MKASTLICHLATLIQDYGDKDVPVKIRTKNEFGATIQYDIHEIVFVAYCKTGIIIEKQPDMTVKL